MTSLMADSPLDGETVPQVASSINFERHKTVPLSPLSSARTSPELLSRKHSTLGNARLRNAKLIAENALKNRKVFTIQGPYPAIRESLRRRGWVEQFYKLQEGPAAKSEKKIKEPNESGSSDSDDDENDYDGDGNPIDVNDHGCRVPPWEEDNGLYGIMSRIVRNAAPSFIWGVRRDCVDPKLLEKDQVINHYGHASFTTKVGLCLHLRDLPWYEQSSSEKFFPRCYRLSNEEEKGAFIEDYVLTASVSLLKHCISGSGAMAHNPGAKYMKDKGRLSVVPSLAITMALKECHRFLASIEHDDIDLPVYSCSEEERNKLINWHYKVVLENLPVCDVDQHHSNIKETLEKMKTNWLQYDLDGTHNIWIVKPGAKSRGRGIQCYNRLEDILKLVDMQVAQRDSKYVVQKYIERPMLVHQTKFDIRQWFVVTDWNPLTVWFYKECYLRFCSQEFTLNNFDESIHLSNNSIQKNYKNGPRAAELPEDNMWHCDQLKKYLQERGSNDVWDTIIYPGMKRAVISALICCQDVVERRKNAFELYGADFMLTGDCHPWLIEINSSPCMAPSTQLTARMCPAVLEDTIRVVIDRKADKNAETGLFELAYRQPLVAIPQYIGMNLQVEGMAIKKLSFGAHVARRVDETCYMHNQSQACDIKTGSLEKAPSNIIKTMSSPVEDSRVDTDCEVETMCKQAKNATVFLTEALHTRPSQLASSVQGNKRRKKRGASKSVAIDTNEIDTMLVANANNKILLRQQSELGCRSRQRTLQNCTSKLQIASDAELTAKHAKPVNKVAAASRHGFVTIANIPNVPTSMLTGSTIVQAPLSQMGKTVTVHTTRFESKRTTAQSHIPLWSTTQTRNKAMVGTARDTPINPVTWSSRCHDSSVHHIRTVRQSDEHVCLVRSADCLPSMPYYPFKPFGSRRSWLWPDDSEMLSKLKYNHSSQLVKAPRDRRFPPRQASVNIFVLGSSLSTNDY